MKEKIILLDLNYTLVANQCQTRMIRPFSARLKAEEYRKDLIEVIKDNRVVIITARPSYQVPRQWRTSCVRRTCDPKRRILTTSILIRPQSRKASSSVLCSQSTETTGNNSSQWRAIRVRGLCMLAMVFLQSRMTGSFGGFRI